MESNYRLTVLSRSDTFLQISELLLREVIACQLALNAHIVNLVI